MRKKKWTIFQGVDKDGNPVGSEFKAVKKKPSSNYALLINGEIDDAVHAFRLVRKEPINDPKEMDKCAALEQGWYSVDGVNFATPIGDLVVTDGESVWMEDYDNGFSENVKYWRHLPSAPEI
jgi:hypothetical protein